MYRKAQNKRRSSRSFNKGHRKTNIKNVKVMRGGYRL